MSRPTPTGIGERSAVRRILVATDFSDGSGAALRRARQLAGEHDAALTLVHVVPEDGGDELRGIAERGLLRLATHFGLPESDTTVAAGSTSAAIAATAEDIGADLIVVGAHGAHWLQDLFVGSTAEAVADAGDVPVLLVKTPGDDPYRTVLIAVDLTERSEPTARGAMAITPGSRHLLLHVATVVGENLLRLSGAGRDELEQLRRVQVEEAAPKVEALAAALGDDAPLSTAVEPGRPETLVPRLVRDVDAGLLAVGTKRLASLRHTLLGSVARHAIRHADCDVLIVRTP